MTINFGNIQAINVNGEVAVLNNQPVVFFTHERIGSAIHEEITAISNAGGTNVTCFEVTLLDFECPFCYPKAALKRKALIEKYDADLAAGSLVKENYGYNNTYARYSY